MRTSTLRKLLFNALIVFQISGCSPVPIPMEEPKILAKLSHIQPHVTTADEVRHILGRPDYEFPEERIWIYQDQAAHFVGPTLRPYYSDYIAEVVYGDDQVVERIAMSSRDAFSEVWGIHRDICLPSGICELRGWYRKILAPTPADERAKTFAHTTESCAIYVYGDDIDDNIVDAISVDGKRYYISDKGFSLISCPPGKYKIRSIGSGNYEHNLNCVAGEVIFLRIGMTQRALLGKGYSPTLEQVQEDVGRMEVTKRRLIASPTTAIPIGAHPLSRRYNPPFGQYIDP